MRAIKRVASDPRDAEIAGLRAELAAAAATAVSVPPLITRLQLAHRAAEKAGDHTTAGALNGVLLGLGEARQKARVLLAAIVEHTDGAVLPAADGYTPELRAALQEVADL